MYLSRTLELPFLRAAAHFPVLMVGGARQVGKTTFLRKLAGTKRRYVTLDDPIALSLAREDPTLFFERYEPPLVLDEIQYAPGLLNQIKYLADQNPSPGRFWLTGSQPFSLMKGVSESLAGRIGVFQLMGLSQREINGGGRTSQPFCHAPKSQPAGRVVPLKELYKSIWMGSFPTMATGRPAERDLFFGSYVQTYLQRDLRDLARVGDEMAFLRFLRVVAARTGQILNLANMARDADISPNTAKSWLSILVSSGLVWLVESYQTHPAQRVVKAPKLHFVDTGLCAYLTGWSSPETLEAGSMSGAILETWVVSQILKSWVHAGRLPPLYHYRDKDQKEIDLLVFQDGILHPIEVKKTAQPKKEDIRCFELLEKRGWKAGKGTLVCLAESMVPLSRDTIAMTVGCL